MPNEPLASAPPIAISTAGVLEQRPCEIFWIGQTPKTSTALVVKIIQRSPTEVRYFGPVLGSRVLARPQNFGGLAI